MIAPSFEVSTNASVEASLVRDARNLEPTKEAGLAEDLIIANNHTMAHLA